MSNDFKPLFQRDETAVSEFVHSLYHAALHKSAQQFVDQHALNDDVSKGFAQRELTAMMVESARETFMQVVALLEDQMEDYHQKCTVAVTSLQYADDRLHAIGVRFTKGTPVPAATPAPEVQPAEPLSTREGAGVIPVEVDLEEAQRELERVTSGIARESAEVLNSQLAEFDAKLDDGSM